jgi:hypothetical protein
MIGPENHANLKEPPVVRYSGDDHPVISLLGPLQVYERIPCLARFDSFPLLDMIEVPEIHF